MMDGKDPSKVIVRDDLMKPLAWIDQEPTTPGDDEQME
jgi:hypothetical protein